MSEFVAPPRWSAAFDTGKGAKNVAGVFEIVFHGNGRFQVNTDRGDVRCKGKAFSYRHDFLRLPDGSIIDGQYPAFIRNRVDFSEPTDAVRKLINEAARGFAATHWTIEQDSAGEIAHAETDIYLAQTEVDKAQAALVEAADKLDAAKARKVEALCNAPAKVASEWAVRS